MRAKQRTTLVLCVLFTRGYNYTIFNSLLQEIFSNLCEFFVNFAF
jgi:hypothetical protein